MKIVAVIVGALINQCLFFAQAKEKFSENDSVLSVRLFYQIRTHFQNR